MQEKEKTIKLDELIDRLKLFLNVKSDNQLSITLHKTPNFIAQARSRNTIDLELLIANCPDADLNWLLVGDEKKERKIARLDSKGNRQEIDLDDSHKLSDVEIKFQRENKDLGSPDLESRMIDLRNYEELHNELEKKSQRISELMDKLYEMQKLVAEYQLREKKE